MGVFTHLNPYGPGEVPVPAFSSYASIDLDQNVGTTLDDELRRQMDDIQPPKTHRGLAKASVAAQDAFMCQWTKYSRSRYPDEKPLDTLQQCTFKNYAGFILWYHHMHPGCKALASYETLVKRIRTAYYNETGKTIDSIVGGQLNAYITGDFCRNQKLICAKKPKPVMGHKGLYGALYYHWTFDTEVFDIERNRTQLSLALLLYAYTAARTGAIVESSATGLRNSNEALRYKDVRLRLLRSTDSDPLLVLEVTILLDKGKRDRDIPKTITLYENRSCPAMCPVIHFAALAFADDAFHPQLIKSGLTPSTMHSFKCPEGRMTIDFTFRQDILHVPILRRSIQDLQGRRVDPLLALPSSSIQLWTRRLGERAGFEEKFTPYCLRRETGTEMTDQGVSDAQRNQIMGHSRSETFLKHYISSRARVDVQAIYLGNTSRMDALREIGKQCLRRDPRLPKELTREEKFAAQQTAEIKEVSSTARRVGDRLRDKFGSMNNGCNTEEGILYRQLRSKVHSLKMRSIREAFQAKLRDFHSNADLEHMVAQLENREPLRYTVEPVEHVLPERVWLAQKLFEPADDTAFAEIVATLSKYCKLNESRGRRQELGLQKHISLPSQVVDTEQHPFPNIPKACGRKPKDRTSQSSSRTPDLHSDSLGPLSPGMVRKRLGPLTCLFCASRNGTKYRFKRRDGLRKHYRNVHFSHFVGPFPCPVPLCDVMISQPEHFANHAVKVHQSDLGVRAAIMSRQPQPWKQRFHTVVNL